MSTLTISPTISEFNQDSISNPIHPLAAYDAHAMVSSNQRWSTIWKVAAVISAIAFISIAAFATAYTSLYLAEHFTLVTIGLCVMLPPAGKFFTNLWGRSDSYAQKADIDWRLIDNMKKEVSLPEGFTPIANGKTLENLKARYQYVKDVEKLLFEESEKQLTEFPLDGKMIPIKEENYTVEKVDFSNPQQAAIFSAFRKHLGYTLGCYEKAALCRLEEAHLLKLMQNPYELKAMDKFFQVVPLTLSDRLLANIGGDDNAFVLAKSKAGDLYTDKDILDMDEVYLAEQLYGLEVEDSSDTGTE